MSRSAAPAASSARAPTSGRWCRSTAWAAADLTSPPRRRPPRWHAVVLVAIGLLGFGRALFWAVTLPVPTPVDEAQHYAYIASLAEHGHIPVTGRDVVGLDNLRL